MDPKRRGIFIFTLMSAILFGRAALAQQQNHLQYVNPFIGTTKSNVPTKWGGDGGTYPGAVAPSGAVQLTPETKITGDRGYNYKDTAIYYFSCFGHMSGFPAGSAGRFNIMPVGDLAKYQQGNYSRSFSHKNEVTSPGNYKVVFDDDHTIVEATATKRTGIFRFAFGQGVVPRIYIGDDDIIFRTEKSLNAGNSIALDFSEYITGTTKAAGGWIYTFARVKKDKKVISLKISRSAIGYTNAQRNIDHEIGERTFDQVLQQTQADWQKQLAVIDITDNNESNKTVFYTALYHASLIPWVIDDSDGSYKGADGQVHQRSGKDQYGGFSPWDTFRSLHPLWSLLYPAKQNDAILSMLDIYKQTGHLPTESMTGNHAIPVIVDAYLKGVSGFDKQLAYTAMKKSIVEPPFVQADMAVYQKNGYVPFTNSESVTRTVEYAYDDWALSCYAGPVMQDTITYAALEKRAFNYRNVFEPERSFFLPRQGYDFLADPGMSGYKEGDKWVYSYFVPHNTQDLINLNGGEKRSVARLDSALRSGTILFDNETVFHLPYLFNQAGRPDLTQQWCRCIMMQGFSNTPGGLPGNDDLGSMSSWYIFSALGIYPVCPGRPLYAIGAPMFRSATIHLPNGKNFVINNNNSSPKNNYVGSLLVNGKPWQQLILPHGVLTKGGSMTFNMVNKPAPVANTKTPLELSETRTRPDIRILSYTVSDNMVVSHQPVYIKFAVKNTGSLGVKTIRLLVNNAVYASKNCLIAKGETVKDSIMFQLYPLGATKIQLEGMRPLNITVRPSNTPPDELFEIQELTAKPLISLGEEQLFQYRIKNIGGLKHTFKVPILVNDSSIYPGTVTLGPGEQKLIAVKYRPVKAGLYHLKTDRKEFIYKVYDDNWGSLIMDVPDLTYNLNGILKDNSGFDNVAFYGFTHNDKDKIGQKRLFGKDTYLTTLHSPSLDELDTTITMMTWVYPTEKERGYVDLFTKGDHNVLQVTDSRTLTFFAGGWGRGDVKVDLPADWYQHWHHIAGVCNGRLLQIYIDGELKGSALTDAPASLAVGNRWELGRNEEFPSERVFHGYMDKVKIFKAPLTDKEIRLLFDKEKQP